MVRYDEQRRVDNIPLQDLPHATVPILAFRATDSGDLHCGSDFFQSSLSLLRVFFGDSFFHRLGNAFHQFLGFLQTQVSQVIEPL